MGGERKGGAQSMGLRGALEGIKAIDPDAGAHEIKMGAGQAQRRRAVGSVEQDVGMAGLQGQRPGAETVKLLLGPR